MNFVLQPLGQHLRTGHASVSSFIKGLCFKPLHNTAHKKVSFAFDTSIACGIRTATSNFG